MTNNNQSQEIKIADNIPGAEYTNLAQINHNKEEFMVMFANILPPTGKVVAKVITTPGHFKRLVSAMQDNLKKYEEKFGIIKEAPEIDKEIGFKS
jgi:23S rRNA U2552 (ribose-2'-O)-methylase RlmE/FtsJ